jgi:4,5-DOPA dioxygenase extradiol
MLQPAFFLGHGSPMNVLADNTYTRAWQQIGASMPKPRAILSISAHWYLPATQVTAMQQPETIHDFYGFPQALFDYQYPTPGDPALAQHVIEMITEVPVEPDYDWGLDHGTWGVLCHVFPEADIPVLQLSIDGTKPAAFHYALGKQLAPLREEGIMILGSGNIVHNLGRFIRGDANTPPYDWAQRFDQAIRHAIEQGDHDTLINFMALGEDAHLSCPTPEHYLPLLYIMALQQPDETVSFPVQGIDGGSVSMLSVQIG